MRESKALERRYGEVPPTNDELEPLEPGTLVIEDEVLRKGFTSVPNYILEDASVSITARFTYVILLSFAWQAGSCFPGQQRLANILGVHKRSVIRFLQELEGKKYIARKRRGLGKTNVYHILKVRLAQSEVTPLSLQEVTQASNQEVTPVSLKEYSGRKDSDYSKSNSLYEEKGETERQMHAEEKGWSNAIDRAVKELTRQHLNDLDDPANIHRNSKRAMNLWRKSGLNENDFLMLLRQAKETTLRFSENIRKKSGRGGSTNQAPYFFAVLEDLIAQVTRKKLDELRGQTLARMPR